MTIGSAIAKTLDHLTPGHKTTPGASGTTNTSTHQTAYTTTSNSPVGTMEQAGAGEYGMGTAATYSGGQTTYASGTTGTTSAMAAGDMVCVPGNVAAPVPVGEKKFIVTEDHAVVKQRVERWVEHQPVEREFVTKVEETGVVTAGATSAEAAQARERIVGEHTCYPISQTTVHGVAGETMDANRRI